MTKVTNILLMQKSTSPVATLRLMLITYAYNNMDHLQICFLDATKMLIAYPKRAPYLLGPWLQYSPY